ncbi:4-hydroxybenzoyl-CoA reductase, beta subunit [mine drainage metagenome]|uniref:4-hydroxybenzoyl-CoA reductase, beta subunit n=1 Tax=mine drainage metagenome TaxID=410659 RepID=T1AJ52_9ZZZZ
MHLDPFELHRPTSVDEVVDLARRLEGRFDYLAGGTDLLPNYKMHLNLRPHLVALEDVRELRGRSLDRIGAMERLADLEGDAALLAAYPPLGDAVREIATPLVRASGTVGGNLLVETRCFFFNQSQFWRQSLGFCLKADGDRCHVVPQQKTCYATFSGDLAPALLAVEAEVELAGAGGRRRLPLTALYDAEGDGIQRLTLAPGELLTAVHLPAATRGQPGTYLKLRVRPSYDFPELGVAASGAFDGDRVLRLRIAVGGAEMRPVRHDGLTEALVGEHLSDDRLRTLAEAVQRATRPVHNTFLLPDYRRRLVSVYVRRAVQRLREGSAG